MCESTTTCEMKEKRKTLRNCLIFIVFFFCADSAQLKGNRNVCSIRVRVSRKKRFVVRSEVSHYYITVDKDVRLVDAIPFILDVRLVDAMPFILDVRPVDAPAGVTQEEDHSGFLHLPSAVLALIFIVIRTQPSLSLVDRDVEFCVPTNELFSACWACSL